MIQQVQGEKNNDGDSIVLNNTQNSAYKEIESNSEHFSNTNQLQNSKQYQKQHQDQTSQPAQNQQLEQNFHKDKDTKHVKNTHQHNHRQLKQVWLLYMMALNTCFGSLFFGYNLGVYNSAQNVISKLNGWDEDQFELYTALITSFMPLGALFGALISKEIIKSIRGIRKCMMIFDIIGIIGTLTLIIDYTVPFMLAGRFISGFCVGVNSALIPVYIKDFSPIQINGKANSLNQILICFGIFCSYIISLVLPLPSETEDGYNDGGPWRIVLGLPVFAPLFRILILLFIFRLEIPTVMIKDHRHQEALQFLKKIYVSEKDAEEVFHGYEEKVNEEIQQEQKIKKKQPNIIIVNQECNDINNNPNEVMSMNAFSMNVLSTHVHSANVLDLPNSPINQEIKNGSLNQFEQQHAVFSAESKSKKVNHHIKTQLDFYHEKIFELSNKETYWKRFILGALVQFCTQCSGINSILSYSNSIFKETSGGTGAEAELIARRATICLGAAMTIFTCPSICLIERFGRRTIFLYGTGLVTFTLFLFAGLQKIEKSEATNDFAVFVILLLGWQISLGAVTWVLNSEILDIKGLSFSYFTRWLITMIVGLLFPYMKKSIDLFGSFLVFGCFTIVLFVYFIFEVQETKGKDRYEILKQYCNQKKYQQFEKIANDYAKEQFEQQKKTQVSN